jgi:hypothetical protein
MSRGAAQLSSIEVASYNLRREITARHTRTQGGPQRLAKNAVAARVARAAWVSGRNVLVLFREQLLKRKRLGSALDTQLYDTPQLKAVFKAGGRPAGLEDSLSSAALVVRGERSALSLNDKTEDTIHSTQTSPPPTCTRSSSCHKYLY